MNIPAEVRHSYMTDLFSGAYVCIYCKQEISDGPEQARQLATRQFQQVCKPRDRRKATQQRRRVNR